MEDFNSARLSTSFGNIPNDIDFSTGGNLPNAEDSDINTLMQLLRRLLGDASNTLEEPSKTTSGNAADKKEEAAKKEEKEDVKSGNSSNEFRVESKYKSGGSDAKESGNADMFLEGLRDILKDDNLSGDDALMMVLQLLVGLLDGDSGNAANPAEDALKKLTGNKSNAGDAKKKTGNTANKKEEADKKEEPKAKGNAADKPEASKTKGNAADKPEATKGKGKGKGKGADEGASKGGKVDLKAADALADKLGSTINRVIDPAAAAKLTAVQSELRTAISEDKLDAKTLAAIETKLEDIADDMDQKDTKKQVEYLAGQIGDLQPAGGTAKSADDQPADVKAFFTELADALTDIAAVAPSTELKKAIEEAVKLLEDTMDDGETPDAALMEQMISIISKVDSSEADAVVKLLEDTKDAL